MISGAAMRNRDRARATLASRLPRRDERLGSKRWEGPASRARGGRIVCAVEHRDFPAMLAEALDMVGACGLDAKMAALRLGVTPTQLVRFVRDHPPALEWWNAGRLAAGEHPLR